MVLDTCFCIDLMRETARQEDGAARKKMSLLQNQEVFISLFTLCELRAGAELSNNAKSELRKIELMTNFTDILYPNNSFSVLYGETEAYLRKKGTPIPVMDLLIAVTAKLAGIPLLTRDSEHFDRIPGLVVETY